METMPATRNKDWAKRICRLMDAAAVSADDLASAIAVDRSTVYSWRNGSRIPSRGIQTKLAKRLRTTLVELNGWAA